MERKDFFKKAGLAVAISLIPFSKLFGEDTGSCTETPEEEEGPFPYPGGEITNPLDRVDITESQTGVSFAITFTLISTIDCLPIEGARIDIWHCNKDGWYSGYDGQSGGVSGTSGDHSGETWLRGYQLTDANGQVQFTTIYPGWYSPRATHLHIEVFIAGTLIKRGQLAFVKSISDTVQTSTLYAAHGVNPTLDANDSVFGVANAGGSGNAATDLTNETFTLAGSVANGYTGAYTIGIDSLSTGVKNVSADTPDVSVYPNPASDNILVSHNEITTATTIRVMSIDGKTLISNNPGIGTTSTKIDLSELVAGIYILVLESANGTKAVKFVKE